MNKNGIYNDWKIRRNQKKYGLKTIQELNQSMVARDIKDKLDTIINNFEKDKFKMGIDWFDSGFTIDEAPVEIRDNASFISGFRRGERLKFINQQLYEEGKKYFEKGFSLDEVPKNYINKEYFILGYNDAMNKRGRL